MVSGRADVDGRITQVLQYKLDGYSTAQIKDLTQCWNVSTRTIDKYISRATEKLTAINLATAEETRGFVLSNLTRLFREAKINEDPKEQHRLLMSVIKATGLDKININMNVEDERLLKSLSNDDLNNIIQEENETNS